MLQFIIGLIAGGFMGALVLALSIFAKAIREEE